MNTAQFLARVSAPGNYLAIGYNRTPGEKGGFAHRFFPEGDFEQAAGFAQWAARKKWDVYHAMASFVVAEHDGMDKTGVPKYRGHRKAENAQRLRAFWIDVDLKREGDGKLDSQCYADEAEAMAWLAGFRKATGVPRPNLAVNSGYGVHVYWVLEEALTVAEWEPYALALKAALNASGFKGDPGISADAARILRPPGTLNMKVLTHPVPVVDLPRFAAGDTVNATMLAALTPFISAADVGHQASRTTMGGTVSALAGGNVSSILSARAVNTPSMTAATVANLPSSTRPRSFATIARGCGQVAHSLATHGKDDPYQVWYLGHLTLAHFCADGADFVHPIGDAHQSYKVAETDKMVAQAARELAANGKGPPSCKHYEGRAAAAICQACPHYGKLKGPWDLGIDDADLPDRYRRVHGGIELRVSDAKSGEWKWVPLLAGDVSKPVLDWRPAGGHALTFDYKREAVTRSIHMIVAEAGTEDGAIIRLFEPQGIHMMPGNERPFRVFLMAWIDKLIGQRATRNETVYPWGWIDDAKGVSGFSVGGRLYRPDGTEQAAPGGDGEMVAVYRPQGTLERWQEAFNFVTLNRPDLQAIIACSFGSPLMRFTHHPGVVVSAWSKQSGVGKSAGMTVAQAVWADQRAMFALQDTPNSVLAKVARSRNMVTLWDETRIITPEQARQFSQMIFELTQGKERSRMRSDTSLRAVGLWQTVLVCAANRPLMDYIVAQDEGTEAGALRIFEFAITAPPMPASAQAAKTIGQAKTNYGRAGEVYARWLAANADTADRLVTLITEDLNTKLGVEQSERLYVAGMAVMLAGAAIASKIGVAVFDQPALRAFLSEHFLRLRASRRRDIVVSSAGYDLEQILASFMADNIGGKLVTSRFGKSGPKALTIRWHPLDRMGGVRMQISIGDSAMRINRATLYEWCRKKNLSGPDIIADMTRTWGAAVGRWILAAGTGYGGGQLWCVELPLVAPELAHYMEIDDGHSHAAQPTKSSPLDRMRGNQPN